MPSSTLAHVKPSCWKASLSVLSRALMNARSSSLTNLALDGQSAMYHQPAAARTIVSKPSMMKIHLPCSQRFAANRAENDMTLTASR